MLSSATNSLYIWFHSHSLVFDRSHSFPRTNKQPLGHSLPDIRFPHIASRSTHSLHPRTPISRDTSIDTIAPLLIIYLKMLTKTFIAAGALLSVAAAIPMQKNPRDVVWDTKIEYAYVTVDVTTTVWLNPGETPPVAPAAKSPGHYGHKHHGVNHHPPKPETTPPAASSSPAESAPATYAPPPATSAAPVASSPAPVAPPPTTTAAPAPATTAPAYSAPTPSPSSPPSSGGGSHGTTYTGDITYYTPGLGSCGITSTEAEDVVALPFAMMAAVSPPNPNDNPYCGRMITIQNGDKTATAKVVDTCPGCVGGSIDLSPTVFTELAAMSLGRVSGVNWWFSS